MKAFVGRLSLYVHPIKPCIIETNHINVQLSLTLILLTFHDHEISYCMDHLLGNYLSFIRY